MPAYNASDAMAVVEAMVYMRDGGSSTVRCWAMDFDRFHGMTVHPFTTDEGQQALFVKADPQGNPTDYVKDGEETDGKSFFHYVDLNLKGRCHFKDGDWTNLCRDNWEANAGRFTKQERRLRRSMNRSS